MPKPLNIDCMSVDGRYSFGIKIPNAKYSNHLISGEIFVPDVTTGLEVDKANGKIVFTEDSFYQDAAIVQFGNHELIRILNNQKQAVYIPSFGSHLSAIPLVCFKLKK